MKKLKDDEIIETMSDSFVVKDPPTKKKSKGLLSRLIKIKNGSTALENKRLKSLNVSMVSSPSIMSKKVEASEEKLSPTKSETKLNESSDILEKETPKDENDEPEEKKILEKTLIPTPNSPKEDSPKMPEIDPDLIANLKANQEKFRGAIDCIKNLK